MLFGPVAVAAAHLGLHREHDRPPMAVEQARIDGRSHVHGPVEPRGEPAERQVDHRAGEELTRGSGDTGGQGLPRAPAIEDAPLDRVHVAERERQPDTTFPDRQHRRNCGTRAAVRSPQEIETRSRVHDRRQVEPDVSSRALEHARRDLALPGEAHDDDVARCGRAGRARASQGQHVTPASARHGPGLNPAGSSVHYPPRMRAVVYAGAGGNEVIRIEERPDPEPGKGEVLIAVRYAGLNPADVQQREGRYPAPAGWPPDVPGLEVGGTVTSCGPGVFRFAPGDRVLGLVGGGGLASRVVAPERHLSPAPDSLDERAIAAIAEGFVTAHDAIRSQAGLTSGETLLVHGAAGGVGSAACQIGVVCGSRVLGVVRSAGARATVESLGAEAVPDEGFVAAVLEATAGVGAHVLLELVGAVHFPDNLDALAEDGRIVIVGSSVGGPHIDLPARQMMTKRATVKGTTLRARTLERKALTLRAFEREVLPHLASGRIKALVDSVYPVERIGEAFDRLSGPGKAGKVLIEFE